MATKSDRPGLLSKMAMFVRNPTKDWSELERPQIDQDSGFDKQVLKQMIERKRQNDFIRKREFDQLRKLRSRGVTALAGMGRPSVFQSSMATDPDGRAVTLKKIDEIEAQMSKQWWKGKQDAAAIQATGFPVAKAEPAAAKPPDQTPAAALSTSEQFGLTESANLGSESVGPHSAEFEPTEMGHGMEPSRPVSAQPKGHSTPMRPPVMGALAQSYDGADVGFSTSKLFAIDVEDMATDPELEEAAIRFANGDDEGAEAGLLDALRGAALPTETASSWMSALLDLYRATNNKLRFDEVVGEFSNYFSYANPLWYAITDNEPGELSPAQSTVPMASPEPETVDYSIGAIWCSPHELTELAMEELRDAMASNATPWHLDWSRLSHISPDAMPLMAGLFSSLCNEPVALRFSGAIRLVDTLRSMMPAGDHQVSPDWWAMRLNALRTVQLLDDFELAALDYCVTYEVSPPAWQEARCQYTNVESENAAEKPVEPAEWSTGNSQIPTVPMEIDSVSAVQLRLSGSVLGDATHALSGLTKTEWSGENIVISCRGLIRVDFSAAGSILNWVALRQSEGCQVQFRDVHRLVAAFFNVIGINEHARVVPRPA